MDKFIIVGVKTKPGTLVALPCTPAAATVATDKDGKEHCSPLEWIATLDSTSIVSQWRWSLKGSFSCAFCNSKENIILTNAHSEMNWDSNLSKLAARAVVDNWVVALLQALLLNLL
jgi:hypothetical protein